MTSGAEAHLMRRRPRRGRGPDGVVTYTLEDLTAPAGEDPKAFVTVRQTATGARVVSSDVPPAHRGHGYGRRLGRQVVAALRAEGCETVEVPEPTDDRGRRLLVDLGFEVDPSGCWQLVL